MARDDRDEERTERMIAERRAANPRHSPGRAPAGTSTTRRLVVASAVVVAMATAVLVVAVLLG